MMVFLFLYVIHKTGITITSSAIMVNKLAVRKVRSVLKMSFEAGLIKKIDLS